MRITLVIGLTLLGLVFTACTTDPAGTSEFDPSTTSPSPLPSTTLPEIATSTTTTAPTTTTTVSPHARPAWLGTRLLPLRSDEFGEVQPTPLELQHRQFETIDMLPPPVGDAFESAIQPVPADVLARSTWTEECPVTLDEISYVTMSHWGFDQKFHTGEMIVNAAWADDIVGAFGKLHEARFPIEQMRVVTQEEVDAHPTGDWNETTSFVCRPAVGSASWSRHAFGLAIDINPFENPYLKGDLVLPELASYYLDRSLQEPGVIHDGDVVVEAFADIGWPWGGDWKTLKDYMHFSDNGR